MTAATFKVGRIIDLSQGATNNISLHGIAKVKIKHIDSRINLD